MRALSHITFIRRVGSAFCAMLMLCSIAPGTVARADAGQSAERGKPQPILRVQAGGPTSEIFQLEFSPDGKTLYAAGRDKVIHVWMLREPTAGTGPQFQYRPDLVRRVPIAPGRWGNLDALAVSPDGRWIAAGGYGAVTSLVADYRMPGFLYSSDLDLLSPEQAEEQGLIYLFDTTQTDRTLVLRGHRGPIVGLAFENVDGKPRLISAATEDSANPRIVLRVWDIKSGRTIQVFDPPPPASRISPSAPHEIEAWTAHGQQFVAFCAWDAALPEATQRLRVFDLTSGKPDGPNRPLYAWCCGLSANGDGQLFLGTHATSKRPPRLVGWSGSALATYWEAPADHSITYVRPIDAQRVALVVLDNKTRAYELIVRDLKGSAATNARSIRLGPWPNPRVAVSKAGFLAVGGNPRHEVEIYPLAGDERANLEPRPVQRLAAAGQVFTDVTFVRKDRETGLRLSELVDGQIRTQLLMNLSASRLEKDAAAWSSSVPDLAAWGVNRPVGGLRRLDVVHDGHGEVWDLPGLPADASITAQALCPSPQVDGLKEIPLRAVALDRHNGDSELNIYDARKGRRLRRCEGHTAAITGLAFSKDGRLLATCAQDRTVSLWWLADLPQTIGKLGSLSDVRLRQVDEKTFIVLRAPSGNRLREGEAILGIFEPQSGGPRLRKFDSVGDFLRGVAEHKPGDQIEIAQTTGRATVTVGQAVDERKPLCSLFFNSDDNRSWSWAAWSPLGPFETSDENIEHKIGWHFNPQRPDSPATFDNIGKYRTDFFGNGLLPKLIEQGKVTDWPPTPRVKVSLQFDPESPAAQLVRGGWTVRDKNLLLFVSVTAPDVDPEIVGVTLQIEGSGTTLELKRYDQARDLWTESLRQLVPRPAVVRLAATVTMRVAGRERRTESLPLGELRLQNQAPAIVHQPPTDSDVQHDTFPFRATIRSIVPATAVLTLNANRAIRLPIEPHRLQEISQSLKLRPGLNELTLRVRNNESLPGFESDEEIERRFFIHFAPGEPPAITITRINALPFQAGDPLIVAGPRIVVEGQIASRQPLLRADCGVLDGELRLTDPQPIWGQTAAPGLAAFRIAVPVKPGDGVVELKAVSSAGEAARSLRFVYRPELPFVQRVEVDSAIAQGVFLPPAARFSVTLIEPAKVTAYTSRVEVDSQPSAGAKLIDDRSMGSGIRKLTWEVPLRFGEHHLAVVVANGFSSFRSETAGVAAKQVPGRVDVMTAEPLRGEPAVQMRLRLPSQARPRALEVSVDGQPSRQIPVRFEPSPHDPTLWEGGVKVGELSVGQHVLHLRGATADGPSAEVSLQAVMIPTIPGRASPKIAILSPREPVEQDSGGVPIVFTVTPKELLGSAQIFLVNGDREERLEAPNPRDNGELRIVNVHLPEGPQTIRIRIIENGVPVGAPQETQVSVLARSVRVQISSLSWKQGDWAFVSRRNGERFGPVGEAGVTAHGEIVWGDAVPVLSRLQSVYVRIWVNAFLQYAAEVRPPVGDRSLFDADLTLGSATDNVIRVELVGVPQRETAAYRVDCRQPDRRQELHLLVVDCAKPAGDREPDLVQQVKDAFGVRSDSRGNAASAVFSRVKLYPSCIGPQVDSNRVFAALVALKLKASQASPVNRVFLLYYRGTEIRSSDGKSFILKTRDATETSGVSSRYLARCFSKLKGAHLVFLDVEDQERGLEGPDPWRSLPPTLGLVRSVNLQPTEKTLATYLREAKSQAGGASSRAAELTLLDIANWLRKRLQNRVDHSLADSPVAMLHIVGN